MDLMADRNGIVSRLELQPEQRDCQWYCAFSSVSIVAIYKLLGYDKVKYIKLIGMQSSLGLA